MKDNKITITVVNTPSYITYYYPYCGSEIKIPYSDLLGMISEYYYGDWIRDTLECPECGKEIEVEYIDRN